MGSAVLLGGGLLASLFVAVNVGGSSTGVAFGPVTGSGALSARRAAGLMTASVLLGGVTLGPRVTRTLGEEFVPASAFTRPVALGVLVVTGLGILLGNYRRVSVSTSGTAVGAVVGLGAAVDAIRWGTVGEVVGWWIAAATLAFWLAAVIGRYAYGDVAAALGDRADRATRTALVAGGCGMAFAAGGSNVANAVGALVGAGVVGVGPAVILGGLGIGAGAFLLGPRTLETVGEGITDLPVEAALIVQAVAAGIITALNVLAIPASLAVTTTMAVVGLGWGRASRVADGGRPRPLTSRSSGADPVTLYDPAVTKRIVATWVAAPAVAAFLSFAAFELL